MKFGARQGTSRDIAESYRAEKGWKRVFKLRRADPPVHTKTRQTMTTYIETVVNDLIDNFIDEGRCDFMLDFSIPLLCIYESAESIRVHIC